MAKRLDRTITRSGVPFVGGQSDDVFHFNIPPGEKYKEARLDILGGRYNSGARVVSQPDSGDTGTGKTIKVNWWFDGGTDPLNPPFIKYRMRAFTVPVTSRAILVAIENTGYIPFPIGVSDDLRRVLERFVDVIAEVVAEQNVRHLFADYYKKVEILVDTHCTKENIRDKIAELGKDYTLDLAILGHGGEDPAGSGQEVLILHGGMDNEHNNLREAEVLAWKNRPDFQNLQLGLVYMMNCHGSQFNDTWLDLGFRTSIGSHGDNWMPEPMFTFFWTRFRNGETAQDAAQKAWEASRNLWQAVYRPDCKLVSISQPPFIALSCEDSDKITESRHVVSGNPALRITDES